jgi:hypothetical protein
MPGGKCATSSAGTPAVKPAAPKAKGGLDGTTYILEYPRTVGVFMCNTCSPPDAIRSPLVGISECVGCVSNASQDCYPHWDKRKNKLSWINPDKIGISSKEKKELKMN